MLHTYLSSATVDKLVSALVAVFLNFISCDVFPVCDARLMDEIGDIDYLSWIDDGQSANVGWI